MTEQKAKLRRMKVYRLGAKLVKSCGRNDCIPRDGIRVICYPWEGAQKCDCCGKTGYLVRGLTR